MTGNPVTDVVNTAYCSVVRFLDSRPATRRAGADHYRDTREYASAQTG